jgi:hypothetical protein
MVEGVAAMLVPRGSGRWGGSTKVAGRGRSGGGGMKSCGSGVETFGRSTKTLSSPEKAGAAGADGSGVGDGATEVALPLPLPFEGWSESRKSGQARRDR